MDPDITHVSESKIIINHEDIGMSELRPRDPSLLGTTTPGGASMKCLLESPNPAGCGPKKPPSTSEIMPLLEAHHRKEGRKKMMDIVLNILKIPALLFLLYVFICSLDFLSTSFRLIAGKAAGSIFQNNPLLANPIVGLMIGILFTVLVQSSSTCTSVIVSMVSSGILDVRTAIPMVMGANVGTSLTSTLVSLTQVTDRVQFERAFSGATVHDCFNWLTVITLLTVEISTGYLYHASLWLTPNLSPEETPSASGDLIHHANISSITRSVGKASSGINILGALTTPLTKKVIQIDKNVLKCWGLGGCQQSRLLKVYTSKANVTFSDFLLNWPSWNDLSIGILLLIVSLVLLSTCLILIVSVLKSTLQGTVAVVIQKTVNSDLPRCSWLTGYLAIIAGAVLTFIVQSSSVFTATLTPLVGIGVISVDRVYPLTLGSNLGTTTTALLAALAADGAENLKAALQIAYCHFLFNLTGIILFYPIPAMRWPLTLCKVLGKTTAKYRWFAIFYLSNMFFIVPAIVLGLSLAGSIIFFSAIIPTLIIICGVVMVNVAQVNSPHILPHFLANWDFLPLWMHSLDPLDSLLKFICCGFNCCRKYEGVKKEDDECPATPPNSDFYHENE